MDAIAVPHREQRTDRNGSVAVLSKKSASGAKVMTIRCVIEQMLVIEQKFFSRQGVAYRYLRNFQSPINMQCRPALGLAG